MNRDVVIPKWGLTLETMVLLTWHVAVGDRVKAGDLMCEVETDKSNAEIEAPTSGRIVELRGVIGGEYPVGETIAVIEAD